uniref:Uncharacterized protein n=1 Tax=Vitis vinifera TaxID=29760 RepID=F6GU82_VITVI
MLVYLIFSSSNPVSGSSLPAAAATGPVENYRHRSSSSSAPEPATLDLCTILQRQRGDYSHRLVPISRSNGVLRDSD